MMYTIQNTRRCAGEGAGKVYQEEDEDEHDVQDIDEQSSIMRTMLRSRLVHFVIV